MFVDLHQAFKQGTRASVEEYSLEKIEAISGFDCKTAFVQSRAAMLYLEHRLELGWGDEELPQRKRLTMEGYNGDDCLSLIVLQEWLENERRALLDNGMYVPRSPERMVTPRRG
jgi:predicted RecB family nuclease